MLDTHAVDPFAHRRRVLKASGEMSGDRQRRALRARAATVDNDQGSCVEPLDDGDRRVLFRALPPGYRRWILRGRGPERRGRRTVRPQPAREAWSTGAEVAGAPVADAPFTPVC